MLQEHLRTHNSELVFPSARGTRIWHANIVNRMWNPLQKAAEVSVLNLHATRHFFASLMISKECSLKELAVSMGHHVLRSRCAHTAIYSRMTTGGGPR